MGMGLVKGNGRKLLSDFWCSFVWVFCGCRLCMTSLSKYLTTTEWAEGLKELGKGAERQASIWELLA